MPDAPVEIISIFARPRMGKTFLARHLASAWPVDRVFVHDPKNQLPQYDLVGPGTIEKIGSERKPRHWVLDAPGSLIIIDEAHRVARPSGYVAGWEWLQILVHEGRHHGLTAVFCARRPSVVHYDLRACVEAVYVGHINASRDIRALVDDVDEECLQVKDLPEHKFLVFYP